MLWKRQKRRCRQDWKWWSVTRRYRNTTWRRIETCLPLRNDDSGRHDEKAIWSVEPHAFLPDSKIKYIRASWSVQRPCGGITTYACSSAHSTHSNNSALKSSLARPQTHSHDCRLWHCEPYLLRRFCTWFDLPSKFAPKYHSYIFRGKNDIGWCISWILLCYTRIGVYNVTRVQQNSFDWGPRTLIWVLVTAHSCQNLMQ